MSELDPTETGIPTAAGADVDLDAHTGAGTGVDGAGDPDAAAPVPPLDERSRTYSWEDPLASFAEGATLSGIEYLRAMAAGKIPVPPITRTLDFDGLGEVEEGRVVFSMTPKEFHYNPIGSVHGGVYATLLDSACGCAVQTLLPQGDFYTSIDLTVKFLRGMSKDTGQVRCIGTVTHMGRRTALAEAKIVDANGKIYATAISSCLIIRAGG